MILQKSKPEDSYTQSRSNISEVILYITVYKIWHQKYIFTICEFTLLLMYHYYPIIFYR